MPKNRIPIDEEPNVDFKNVIAKNMKFTRSIPVAVGGSVWVDKQLFAFT